LGRYRFSSISMKKGEEGIEEMRFDKLDPSVERAQINLDISRKRGWRRNIDRFGRHKTGESGSSDLSGQYRRSGFGLGGGSGSRGLPESRCLRVGLSLSGILRLENEWRFGNRSWLGGDLRLGLW
jgi:hypothetical protein